MRNWPGPDTPAMLRCNGPVIHQLSLTDSIVLVPNRISHPIQRRQPQCIKFLTAASCRATPPFIRRMIDSDRNAPDLA